METLLPLLVLVLGPVPVIAAVRYELKNQVAQYHDIPKQIDGSY